jgi:UDP-N-acetylglucosamine:LPS N-acetylglucosamine transferase
LNLGGKRVLVAGGSEGKLLISHVVLTAVCSVATWKSD